MSKDRHIATFPTLNMDDAIRAIAERLARDLEELALQEFLKEQ